MLRASPRSRIFSSLGRLVSNPTAVGTACCVGAAVGYTGVNLCVRLLTVRCDQLVLLLIKELVAVVLVGPWLIWRWRRAWGSAGWRHGIALAVVGSLTQVGANLPVIWAMAVVGLAITITVCLGVNLVASALLGRILVGERVSRQSLWAIGLLIGSVIVLSVSAERTAQSHPLAHTLTQSPWMSLLAVAAVCGAGVIYGLLNVAIRQSVTERVPVGLVAFLVPGMAVVWLGPVCWWRLGLAGMFAMPLADLMLMLLCGLLNLLAFLAFIKGLELTSIVHANVLVASEVAMAAVAGVVLFGEAAGAALLLGVAMTLLGMLLIDHRPSS